MRSFARTIALTSAAMPCASVLPRRTRVVTSAASGWCHSSQRPYSNNELAMAAWSVPRSRTTGAGTRSTRALACDRGVVDEGDGDDARGAGATDVAVRRARGCAPTWSLSSTAARRAQGDHDQARRKTVTLPTRHLRTVGVELRHRHQKTCSATK